MPFSFSPGQSATQAAPGAGIAPSVATDPSVAPSVPNSPFLFIQQRGRELTVNAYLQIVLLLLVGLSILGAVTIMAYSFYLRVSLDSKKEELAAKEASFKEYPFAEMKSWSDRAHGLDVLLKSYVSIRSPLKLLEDVVEKQVVFSELTVSKEKSGEYVANMVAVTRDYPSLIQQLEALSLTQYSKIVPTTKLDKFTQEKNLDLKVKITTPLFAQGILPEDLVFVSPANGTPPAQSPVTPSNQVVPITPSAPVTPAQPIGGATNPR